PLEAARRCAFLRTPGISGGLGRRASAARRPTSGLTSAASCEPHDALPRNNSLAVYSWTVTQQRQLGRRTVGNAPKDAETNIGRSARVGRSPAELPSELRGGACRPDVALAPPCRSTAAAVRRYALRSRSWPASRGGR